MRVLCLLLLTLVLAVSSACTLSDVRPSSDETPDETPGATAAPPTTPNAAAPASPWESIAPGLERRVIPPDGSALSQVVVLRVDPARYAFRAHYRPGDPLDLDGWRETLPGAAALINSNFYETDNTVLGLLIADGARHGVPYTDRGGLFTVDGEQVRVRSTLREPYAWEPLDQAVQAFPMLVLDGAAAYTAQGPPARRSAIGQDRVGRVLLFATPGLGLSLAAFSTLLADSALGLDLESAFNLDGGGSTMLLITAGDITYRLPGFDPVPAVLAVYLR